MINTPCAIKQLAAYKMCFTKKLFFLFLLKLCTLIRVHYLGFIMLMENSVIRTVVPGAIFLF